MIIGVPKEVKDHEARVGLTPQRRQALVEAGHHVLAQTGAGLGSSLHRRRISRSRARRSSPSAEALWTRSDLVIKVKEPQPSEYAFLRPGLTLFTYLHLAPLPELTDALLNAKVNAVAYETIREADNSLPLLTPMSEVAGRMAVQVGAQYLEAPNGRPGHPARRRAGRRARQRGHSRWRRRRPQRRENGRRARRARHHHRKESEPPPRAGRHLFQPGSDPRVERLHHPRIPAPRRLSHRRRADPRRQRSAPGPPRHAAAHEKRLGDGRRRHRPGRLL